MSAFLLSIPVDVLPKPPNENPPGPILLPPLALWFAVAPLACNGTTPNENPLVPMLPPDADGLAAEAVVDDTAVVPATAAK